MLRRGFIIRIGINALCLSPQMAGISHYARSLISEYAGYASYEHQIVVFAPDSCKGIDLPRASHIDYVFLKVNTLILRVLHEQFVLPVLFRFYRLGILHSVGNVCPILLGRRNAVSVHDVYYYHMPSRFSRTKRFYLRFFVSLSVKTAQSVITVSEATRNDLIKFIGVDSNKISVIYEGYRTIECSPERTTEIVTNKYRITSPYFLFVGTIEPGKNIGSLVEAFKPLSKNILLVIAGKWGWGYQDIVAQIEMHQLEPRIVFTGWVTNEELAALYQNAYALILPSFHEGFGLPIIEAQSYGVPVCCSNSSSLPEVAGDGACLFDPHSVEEITEALRTTLDPTIREKLIENGKKNVKRFSWDSAARETMRVLLRCG